MKKIFNIRNIAAMALLIACEIILTRFLSVNLQFLRIGFGFIPIVIIAIRFGPVAAGVAYAIGDVLGALIFPTGPYFPGFTLSSFIVGLIYGLLLYGKKITWQRCLISALTVNIAITLGLNTLWLSILYGKGYIPILTGRFLEAGVNVVLQTLLIPVIDKLIIKKLPPL